MNQQLREFTVGIAVKRLAVAASLACGLALIPQTIGLAQLDICGCASNPNSLGAFSTTNAATYPPGTVAVQNRITLPLPADGVMVFDSINIANRPAIDNFLIVAFKRNAANTPATILVKGNVTIVNGGFTYKNVFNPVFGNRVTRYPVLFVGGDNGGQANTDALGTGGLGGPGGFKGGDGAYQRVNIATDGGAGLGPLGGLGAVAAAAVPSTAGTFASIPELLPLLGGSGGGGGFSASNVVGCAAGGGGGGGGAVLLAVNGVVTIDGTIDAEGGDGGGPGNGNCASYGSPGSGGAVRIVAGRIAGAGYVIAGGGTHPQTGAAAGEGAIRLESAQTELLVSHTEPVAMRAVSPGPLSNPFLPTVAITAVSNIPAPATPSGSLGLVDVTVPAPGAIPIDIATSGVPSGTTVDVTAKAHVGPAPIKTTVTLTNCNASGACIATATMNLQAGTYAIEARATFATPQ